MIKFLVINNMSFMSQIYLIITKYFIFFFFNKIIITSNNYFLIIKKMKFFWRARGRGLNAILKMNKI